MLHTPYKVFQLFQATKLNLQAARFIEQKLVYLFQYCVMVQRIYDFLKCEPATSQIKRKAINNIKIFFIRDIIYFLCNTLMDTGTEIRIKQAVCTQILRFCKGILPKCSEAFGPHLNFVVSALLPMCRQESTATIALACLHVLIIEQNQVLAENIALLDNFPNDEIFTELRQTHLQIKYNNTEFTLTNELEYFLKIKKRKIEGLSALREQVWVLENEYLFISKCFDFN